MILVKDGHVKCEGNVEDFIFDLASLFKAILLNKTFNVEDLKSLIDTANEIDIPAIDLVELKKQIKDKRLE
jgi:hypothetical protein